MQSTIIYILWFIFYITLIKYKIIIFKDVPEPPRYLAVESIKDDSVGISWKAPANDGGSQITNYSVEKLEIKNENSAPVWIRCGITRNTNFNDETVYPVSKYQYRVVADNMLGRSAPCDPTPVITTPGKISYII